MMMLLWPTVTSFRIARFRNAGFICRHRRLLTTTGASKSKDTTFVSRNNRFSKKRRQRWKGGRKEAEAMLPPKKEAPTNTMMESTQVPASSNQVPSWQERLKSSLIIHRYRATGSTYTKEQVATMGMRLPLAVLLAGLYLWEDTSPVALIRLIGPSMLPTMSPDQSDIWFITRWSCWQWLGFKPSPKVGDLVGWAHPDHPHHVSCKRVIGVAGDAVQRYGQYVHLYVEQDPNRWGINWPDPTDPVYAWMDPSTPWDVDRCLIDKQQESRRKIVIPPDHVWIEADCPGLGIDSRQFGPIPIHWIKGRIVARAWPLWREDATHHNRSLQNRPHPIPLDAATLSNHNVHARA